MSDETTLLPCPFCGGEAQVMHMDLDSIEEGWKVWGVWCVDDLNAEDYRSHGHYIDNYATEAEAIAAWNTRTDYYGYEQAAIEAWKSIKAWNTRATHGTLTAEQVRELIAPHLHAIPTFDFGHHGAVWEADFQAIADELNAELGSGTCEMIPLCSWLFECSKCSEKHHKDDLRKYNYCPNCGAKVVSE